MTELSHDEVRSLLGAYVLGALPDDELPAVRSHVASCPECGAEIEWLSPAVEALSLDVDPVAPPPGFGERVLARVARRVEPAPPLAARRRPRGRLIAVAAAVLLGAAALVGVARNARETAEVHREAAVALLRAAEGIELSGEPGVEAKVVPTEDGAVFVATGLSEPPDDRTYQLWFIRAGTPQSAGTFEVSRGVALLRTTRPAREVEQAAVTVEPSGGSRQPTTEPVIRSG